MLWPHPVQSTDRFLRHKTTRRTHYDAALKTALQKGYADAIFYNEDGIVTEGAISSLIVRHGDRWRTPPLDAGVLPGVYRRFLLETRPEITEAIFSVSELFTADEVWLTNAVRGMRRVTVEENDPGMSNG
jgi:para-aminobenzoate synthetase/4-amino-4-deoxychorismate lyase